jgi:secreted trypsin-like serine protease
MQSPTSRVTVGVGLAAYILLIPASSQAILDGHLAETCAFPSLVRLDTTRSHSSCSASYIGGRVLVTAAHCLDEKGYYLDHEILQSS